MHLLIMEEWTIRPIPKQSDMQLDGSFTRNNYVITGKRTCFLPPGTLHEYVCVRAMLSWHIVLMTDHH